MVDKHHHFGGTYYLRIQVRPEVDLHSSALKEGVAGSFQEYVHIYQTTLPYIIQKCMTLTTRIPSDLIVCA